MALADTAKLLASLDLDTKPFEAGTRRAGAAISGMETRFGKIGSAAQQGLGTAARNIGKIGIVASGAIALAVKGGVSSLAELEDATTAVDGAISQMGLTGEVTSAQIATWANDIERNVQAAFDDKEITNATATLIRLGKIAPESIRPAMEVMTDLAATMGTDVPSAGKQLGKALAAPEKAAGKLARVGVILTETQQDEIEALVEAGDKAGAQAKLLDILATSTQGAAAASKGPFNDAMNTLNDVFEDARRALAIGFLPVLSKLADFLSTELAKPATIDKIKALGSDLAGGFDKALEIAKKIPWGTIGDSLRIAGAGAKAVFDAFTTLPPWIQTAVLTGWGLNKLSGGALGTIVGELGKGLIKGVLGMNAGVVNINAGVVRGGGLPGGGGGGTNVVPAGKGGIGTISKFLLAAEAIGLIVAVKDVADAVTSGAHQQAQGIHETLKESLAGQPTVDDLRTKLAGIDSGIKQIKDLGNIPEALFHDTLVELESMHTEVVAAIKAQTAQDKTSREDTPADEIVDAIKDDRKAERRQDKTVEVLGNIAKAIRKAAQDEPEDTSKKNQKHFDRVRNQISESKVATIQKLQEGKAATQEVRNRIDVARAAQVAATIANAARVAAAEANAADRIIRALYATQTNVSVHVSPTGGQYQVNHLASNKPKTFGA